MNHAPTPWGFEAAGKLGGKNSGLNFYITDANGRKIAAVWGKRGEKQETTAMMIAAPELYAGLEAIALDKRTPDWIKELAKLTMEEAIDK